MHSSTIEPSGSRNAEWASQLLAGAGASGPGAEDPDALAVISNLLNMVQGLRERGEQLEVALESRVAIEQAKGRLAERFDLEVDDAFELLRRGARSARVSLQDLASRVAVSRETPVEVSSALARIDGSSGGRAAQ
jgi:ANTAR domain